MSNNPLRKDKTCLNCRHVVENRFCPNCGQENTDTRKTFVQLFIHFFEDLTHYENSFWKTIRNLIFKPSALTKEYLSGKRMSYLAPIRLYIFISFVTFFLISIIPDNPSEEIVEVSQTAAKEQAITTDPIAKTEDNLEKKKWIANMEKKGYIDKKAADSLQKAVSQREESDDASDYMNFGYRSVEHLDSIQKFGKADEKLSDWEYWINKKILLVKKGKTKEEVYEKLMESFTRNIPKALFIYMPLFAFVLWLFQSKKRWYYFDHGIFTLHYFSFLLLASLILELFNFFIGMLGNHWVLNTIVYIVDSVIIVYMLYYFFPAHHRFYEQSRFKTIIKGIFIFFINLIILTFILIGLFFFSFINIH
ncbi:DUF3667 domain-containing protein [Flavobacterium sp. J49]|uniref:DUF3667 domain-containing protein n=1 Tax=Flavobacterium sp. J49 TaxID=2718534 RepID=UPI00159342D6|nr:DUF3667 domain-containing protein [Flavobacterium sp. J49]MBF6642298.1 DUF3667 domain-containing protein [Flavobacterium sp. J49]NIC03544.1 DUF3667 domain-containing protein [Flavobacterium sp. J49]